MITIWRESFDAFWIQEPVTLRVNLTILKNGKNDQVRVRFGGFVFPTGYLYLKHRGVKGSGMCNLDVVSQIGVICCTYRMVNLQWDSMRKSTTGWANIYGSLVLEMWDTIFARYGKKFTDTACTT